DAARDPPPRAARAHRLDRDRRLEREVARAQAGIGTVDANGRAGDRDVLTFDVDGFLTPRAWRDLRCCTAGEHLGIVASVLKNTTRAGFAAGALAFLPRVNVTARIASRRSRSPSRLADRIVPEVHTVEDGII